MKIKELKEYLESLPEKYLDNEVALCVEDQVYNIYGCDICSEDLYDGGIYGPIPIDQYEDVFEEIPDKEDLIITKGSLILKN
nr:MAG TPA: hypothetical protein [Caudoviricetes sp.]